MPTKRVELAGDLVQVQEMKIDIPNLRALPANNTKRIVTNKKTNRPIIVDSVKGRSGYLKTIRLHASMTAAREDWKPDDDAVAVDYLFFFARPKCQMRTGRNAGKPKDSAPDDHTSRPDVINLIKPVEDALTGIVWIDDAQVVSITGRKFWAIDNRDSVVIIARRLVDRTREGKGQK